MHTLLPSRWRALGWVATFLGLVAATVLPGRAACLCGDTVTITSGGNNSTPVVVSCPGTELPCAGPVLGFAGPSCRFSIDIEGSTIRIVFTVEQDLGAGTLTFSGLNCAVACPNGSTVPGSISIVSATTSHANFMPPVSHTANTVTLTYGNSPTPTRWNPGDFIELGIDFQGNCPTKFECGMTVATCFSGSTVAGGNGSFCGQNVSDPNGFVLALMDTRNPAANGAVVNQNWTPASFHNAAGPAAHQWRASNLGEVFGLAFDGQTPPNIYVTATSIYPPDQSPTLFGPGGSGGVYKIDGTTFNITPFTSLSGVGSVSLGNICHDKANNQFFISELDGGTIRCVNSGGAQVSSFDHGTTGLANQGGPTINNTSGAGNLTNPGRRVFGLQVYQGRLYYAVWDNSGNAIWSVGVVPNGVVPSGANGPRREIAGAVLQSPQNTPITDIAFSQSGKMLLAERNLCVNNQANLNTSAHNARVLEFTLVSGVWTASPFIQIGTYGSGRNSAGGVDYDCNDWRYASGDALHFSGPADYIYGVEILPAGVNNVANSYLIDLDANTSTLDKTFVADVEVYRCCSSCVCITNTSIECVGTNKTYWWQFCITNCWTYDIKYFSFLDLPAGVTLSEDIITLQTPLAPGQGTCLSLYLTNTGNLTNLCFTVGAHTTNFLICCSVTNCLTLAPCCVWIFHDFANPIPGQPNCYTYTPAVIRNVSSTPMKYLFLVPQPDAPNNCFQFSPNVITFNPALLPGQTASTGQKYPQTLKLTINPGCPKPYCFLASLHDSNLVNCCSSREYLTHVNMPVDFPGGLDGSVFEAGSTIRVPVIIDGSNVHPKRAIGYEGSNEVARIVDPTDGQHDDWFVISNAVPGTYVLTAELIDELDAAWRTAPATIYVAGEQPVPPVPAPLLLNPAIAGGQASFSMQTEAGVTCSVEYTESLASPNWTLLQSIVGDGTVMTVTDSITNGPQRFYRVRVP